MIKRNVNILITSVSVLLSTAAFSQTYWDTQNTGISNFLEDIDFANSQVGFAVGHTGALMKTSNGGGTWTSQNSFTSQKLKGVQFLDANTGFVVGYGGTILKTTDGGTTWVNSAMGDSLIFEDVFFLNALQGWVCGVDTVNDFGVVYKTADGGATWLPAAVTSINQNITSIDFISGIFGYCVTAEVGYYTTDGGSVWFPLTSMPTGPEYTRINVYNSSYGWATATNGNVYYTSTGGTMWALQPTPSTGALFDIEIIDQDRVFIVGSNGMVLKTTNGGTNWVQQAPGSFTNQLIGVSAVDSVTVWVCGENGKVYHGYGPDTDLEIVEYLSPVTVCNDVPFDVVVRVQNNNPLAITSGNFEVLNGIDPVLNYDWSGNVAPYGGMEIINLGSITLDQNTALSIVFTGDSVADNNALFQPVSVSGDVSTDVNGPHYVCPGDAVQLRAEGGNSYYWLNATPDSTQQTQYIVATQSNDYVVEITLAGCVITDTVQVIVADDCTINAFSPNDDGVNDLFVIEGLENQPNTVRLFNRWGDEIRFFTNYDNAETAWNGEDAAGNKLDAGSYFYVVETNTRSFSGFVQVVN